MNNYNVLSKAYQKTDVKPDKLFSILPTTLHLLKPLSGKYVLDVGCGSGFFSRAIAKDGAHRVYGIDNCIRQIRKAKKNNGEKIVYFLADMFNSQLPRCDIINAPFVINYAKSISKLKCLLTRFYNSLNYGGKFLAVVDLPDIKQKTDGIERKKAFGAVKKFSGKLKDGTRINILLYNNKKYICRLTSYYYSKETLGDILRNVGFSNIKWHKPFVSKQGKTLFGADFWKYYKEYCELGYVTAKKSCVSGKDDNMRRI